jgi:MoaA/NifB/PqqE/SkfB family radical SAM enzyme
MAPPPEADPWIGPNGERMRRLELHLTYTCPERCLFCSEDHRMAAFKAFPVTYGRAVKVLLEQAKHGVESVHLTGGEPTIHPRFVDVLKLAKGLGMRTSIGTIGTRLADPAFAETALPWLDEALFSVHGPDAATHDACAGRAGSFDRVMAAIANCSRKPGFRPYVNTVVTRRNIDTLDSTVALARSFGATLQILSSLTPEGAGADHYDELLVRLPELRALAPTLITTAGPMILRFFGAPACALGSAKMASNDLYWNPRVTVEWARHPDRVSLEGIFSWAPDRGRRHAAPCERCAWKGVCPGVFSAYLDRFGDAEILPLEAA